MDEQLNSYGWEKKTNPQLKLAQGYSMSYLFYCYAVCCIMIEPWHEENNNIKNNLLLIGISDATGNDSDVI